MKYIDADRLKAEIERLAKTYQDSIWRTVKGETAKDFRDKLLSVIDSLRQEQPEGLHFTPLNRLIQKIPYKNWNDTVNDYAKKLRDCLIKEGYRKDAEVLQGYISYMNGNNVPMATMDEQVQPEVDLDEEIRTYLKTHHLHIKDGGRVVFDNNDSPNFMCDIRDIARHFFNLGLNARKED